MVGGVSSGPDNKERLRRIEAMTDPILSRFDLDELVAELLRRLRTLLEVETAAVFTFDSHARQFVATAESGVETLPRHGMRLPADKGLAGRIRAEKAAVRLELTDQVGGVIGPASPVRAARSVCGVPLMADGKVVGVLLASAPTGRIFSDDDVAMLQVAADRIGLASQARLSSQDRAAALALQRSLLPTELPAVAGVELAARYLPGHDTGVGGDWYDVFTIPSGWLCVVVGDVAGRGLRAAVVMGRLRSALRAYALECDDPAEALGRLDRKALHFEPETMATVLYAMLDPTRDHMLISLAGHLAPVLLAPGSPATVVDVPVDPPVGAGSERDRHSVTIEVAPGALLFCYTDGLVESRDRTISQGIQRLCDIMEALTAEDACDEVMAQLVDSDSTADDVSMLALRRTDSLAIPAPRHG